MGQESITKNGSKPKVMDKVTLLLDKRQEGICEDNMEEKDIGLKKWRIGKMIGSGGTGRVYRAMNIQTGCLYAVKKVHLCEADEEDCKN